MSEEITAYDKMWLIVVGCVFFVAIGLIVLDATMGAPAAAETSKVLIGAVLGAVGTKGQEMRRSMDKP